MSHMFTSMRTLQNGSNLCHIIIHHTNLSIIVINEGKTKPVSKISKATLLTFHDVTSRMNYEGQTKRCDNIVIHLAKLVIIVLFVKLNSICELIADNLSL